MELTTRKKPGHLIEIGTFVQIIEGLSEHAPMAHEFEQHLQRGAWLGDAAPRSQKAHWLGWLSTYNATSAYRFNKGTVRTARVLYQRVTCAPMLFWLAEASGLE